MKTKKVTWHVTKGDSVMVTGDILIQGVLSPCCIGVSLSVTSVCHISKGDTDE